MSESKEEMYTLPSWLRYTEGAEVIFTSSPTHPYSGQRATVRLHGRIADGQFHRIQFSDGICEWAKPSELHSATRED